MLNPTEQEMARFLAETAAMGPREQAAHMRQHWPDLLVPDSYRRCAAAACEEPPQAPLESWDGLHFWGLCVTHRDHPDGDRWIVRRLRGSWDRAEGADDAF